MKKTYFLILLVIVSLKVSFAQQGKNGAETISVNNTIVNEYTVLTADAAAGSTSITVANNTLNTNGRFSSSLSAGDLVMIIQMQGAAITSTQDSTWGTVTNYNNCGLNEFAQVTGVTGTTTINLKCPIQNSYTASANTQIIRVPRLTALTINTNDTLTCDAWNGATGAVISLEIQNNTTIDGAISAAGKGFRGGALQNGGFVWMVYTYASLTADTGGIKGESIAGYQNDYRQYGGMYGRGAPANGGGGGNSTNAAGGGGANAGNSNDWTGKGNPDTTTNTAYKEAWNLEYNGFANSFSSGGGRGGYACSNQVQNSLTAGPGNTAWGNCPWCYRDSVGGEGGHPLDYSAGRLFLGGGGGAGQENNNNGGGGGNGGGIIYLMSYGTISGTGTILSNGQSGGIDNGGNGNGDGAGGAGAGGTVVLESAGTISGITITANGGTGGNQYITNEAEGGGGGGGGGYVATSNGGIITQVNGGANGVTNSTQVAGFPPNGATKGGDGIDTVLTLCVPQISAIRGLDSVCSGSSVTYSVSAVTCSGIPAFIWALPSGWSESGFTDSSITVTAGDTGGMISVSLSTGGCGAGDTAIIMVTVNPAPPLIIVPASAVFCSGLNAPLYVSGSGSGFTWTPAAGLIDSSSNGDSVVVSPSVSTTYTVMGTDSTGCAATGSVAVTVIQSPNKPTFSQDGDTLISSSKYDNQWYRNDTLLKNDTSQDLIVTVTGQYWVIVNNEANGCSTSSDSAEISPTGINQLSVISNQLSIYPNPFNNQLTIISNHLPIDEVDITNELGQILLKVPFGGFGGEIDLSGLSNGVYFITIVNKTGRAAFPIIKQN